jgi:hypothetical protein
VATPVHPHWVTVGGPPAETMARAATDDGRAAREGTTTPMIWALLAAYLTRRPPWVQASVFGACTGFFVAAAVNADVRNPLFGSVAVQVITVGVVSGGAFFAALRAQLRHRATGSGTPTWVHSVYAVVWLLSIGAAAWALLSDGGFKVAALAIVPIVLLAPPALLGIRALLHRPSQRGTPPTADPTTTA